MTDAWMKRGAERQQLLETLQRAIIDQEEETHRRMPAQLKFNAAFLEFFAEKDGGGMPFLPPLLQGSPERIFFREKVVPGIEQFARTPEEAVALVADLFVWHGKSIAHQWQAGLRTQEIVEPQKVFAGHGAMDDVP